MTLKLESTASRWVVKDPGGWSVEIRTNYSAVNGWNAQAYAQSDGLKEERAAIETLRPALRALLRQLDEEFADPSEFDLQAGGKGMTVAEIIVKYGSAQDVAVVCPHARLVYVSDERCASCVAAGAP